MCTPPTRTHTCMNTRAHMHTHMYAHTHSHIHTQTGMGKGAHMEEVGVVEEEVLVVAEAEEVGSL